MISPGTFFFKFIKTLTLFLTGLVECVILSIVSFDVRSVVKLWHSVFHNYHSFFCRFYLAFPILCFNFIRSVNRFLLRILDEHSKPPNIAPIKPPVKTSWPTRYRDKAIARVRNLKFARNLNFATSKILT